MKEHTVTSIKFWVLICVVVVVLVWVGMSWRGISRGCSGCYASSVGADWIVVQVDLEGRPFRCWELDNVSVANESQSDGVYWEESNGNLVHISGLYNRVQISGENWDEGFSTLGLTREECRRIRDGRRVDREDRGSIQSNTGP
jgi:hypothetical protein